MLSVLPPLTLPLEPHETQLFVKGLRSALQFLFEGSGEGSGIGDGEDVGSNVVGICGVLAE